MCKQGCFGLLMVLFLTGLCSCTGTIWTGANLVYDRHDVYKKLDDYHLYAKVNNALAQGKVFQCSNCVLDVGIFNGDVVIAGHLPTQELMDELQRRLNTIKNYRRLFNEVRLKNIPSNTLQDSWITTKIRSQIFADSSIDPNAFKVVTSDNVVYLMGDVRLQESETVVNIARKTTGVIHVVKVMKYLIYQK